MINNAAGFNSVDAIVILALMLVFAVCIGAFAND